MQASSLHATSPQRAPTRAQLKAGLPSLVLTLLCVRHSHCDSSAREVTLGGSALHVVAVSLEPRSHGACGSRPDKLRKVDRALAARVQPREDEDLRRK